MVDQGDNLEAISTQNPRKVTKSPHVLSAVINRRSTGRLKEPGPGKAELESIIKAAISAPDHGRLRPWRFVVFQGEARDRFGIILADALRCRLESEGHTPTELMMSKERNKLLRAPCVIAVGAAIDRDSHIPVIEQFGATAAACENMLIAATALGLGSMWRTGDPSYDNSVKVALGLRETDMIAGWIYLGSVEEPPSARAFGGDVEQYVSHWK